MGLEARCTVSFSGQSSEGKAHLESDALLFRGDFRLAISFKSIQSVTVEDPILKVTFSEGVALFHLGSQAEKWAEKIQNPKGLLDKLGVKPDAKISVIGIDDENFLKELRGRSKEISEGKVAKGSDLVFIGVKKASDLKRVQASVKSIQRDGAIWTVSLKGKTGVKEAEIMAAAKEVGLVPVKVARFSETHTANKFVIPVARR